MRQTLQDTTKRKINKILLALTAIMGIAIIIIYGSRLSRERPEAPKPKPTQKISPQDSEKEFAEISALLPEQSTVAYRLEKGKNTPNHRLQLMCNSTLSAQRILSFYDTELAIRGWKKYNGKLPSEFGIASRMLRKGNLSLMLHVFENGGAFRLSIIRSTLGNDNF